MEVRLLSTVIGSSHSPALASPRGSSPRAFVAGIYHLGSHGSDDRCLFLSDGHLLLRIPDARVSWALQQLHTWYSRLHNKLNRRSAHLFRAHFFARELESDEDLLWTARYVGWNPIEAGLAPHPFAWVAP